jgi:hypothetical protein
MPELRGGIQNMESREQNKVNEETAKSEESAEEELSQEKDKDRD